MTYHADLRLTSCKILSALCSVIILDLPYYSGFTDQLKNVVICSCAMCYLNRKYKISIIRSFDLRLDVCHRDSPYTRIIYLNWYFLREVHVIELLYSIYFDLDLLLRAFWNCTLWTFYMHFFNQMILITSLSPWNKILLKTNEITLL